MPEPAMLIIVELRRCRTPPPRPGSLLHQSQRLW